MLTTLRPTFDLATVPARLRRLPVYRGFPVPWFVSWLDGPDGPETVPEFRAMDARKWQQALAESRCWVCGEKLGTYRVFVIGPMCGINRTTSEPPCHADCAEWSAINCPFLSRPKASRRDDADLLAAGAEPAAGCPIERNPGVVLLWWTRDYKTFRPGHGQPGQLIELGAPTRVRWICEGRDATRAEVAASIAGGLPALRQMCDAEPLPWRQREAHAALTETAIAFETFYPAEATP